LVYCRFASKVVYLRFRTASTTDDLRLLSGVVKSSNTEVVQEFSRAAFRLFSVAGIHLGGLP